MGKDRRDKDHESKGRDREERGSLISDDEQGIYLESTCVHVHVFPSPGTSS